MSAPPADHSSKRRHSSSSDASTLMCADRSRMVDSSVPRSHPTPNSEAQANATLRAMQRSRRPSVAQRQQSSSPGESAALYYRSCELFPRPMASRPNSPPRQALETDIAGEQPSMTRSSARPERTRHDSAVSYFDDDPYRNSADEHMPLPSPTSPTSVRRPPADWSFARQRKQAADHVQASQDLPGNMQSLLHFNSSSSPELTARALAQKQQQLHLQQPPQTITYWTAPREHTDSAQLWQQERHGLRKAFRLLRPAWLLRISRRNSNAHGGELHYWDGEDDRCTVRRFKVR